MDTPTDNGLAGRYLLIIFINLVAKLLRVGLVSRGGRGARELRAHKLD